MAKGGSPDGIILLEGLEIMGAAFKLGEEFVFEFEIPAKAPEARPPEEPRPAPEKSR